MYAGFQDFKLLNTGLLIMSNNADYKAFMFSVQRHLDTAITSVGLM